MKKNRFRVVAMGASAGGLPALVTVLSSLPVNFPAAILVVQHMAADISGDALVQALQKHCSLRCRLALADEPILPGRVYLAPPDHHLLVSRRNIVLSKGARENRSRPGIDPLFRSAAVAFGSGLIGVLLTGYLDDGTSGLIAIHRCGGVCVVQDPKSAAYPDMPQNAVNNAEVDYCVPLEAMGDLLVTLLKSPPPKSVAVPPDVALEATIAERVLSDLKAVDSLGEQVPFNCPDCGGVLWQMKQGPLARYRCHTGHSFTAKVLLAEQTKKLEETLWVALRMFEERKHLLTMMSHPPGGRTHGVLGAKERLKESQVHIERIRAILFSGSEIATDQLPSPTWRAPASSSRRAGGRRHHGQDGKAAGGGVSSSAP